MSSETSFNACVDSSLSVTEAIFQLEQSLKHRLSDLRHLDAAAAVPRLLAGFRKLTDYTNAVAPINRLPPELRSMVFKLAVIPRPGYSFHARSVVALTHVCRLWRDVAIGDASLWCHIDLNAKKTLYQLCIQRSSGCPIILHVSTDTEKVRLLGDVVQHHEARIRAIRIDGGCIQPMQCSYYDYASTVLDSLRLGHSSTIESLFVRGWLSHTRGFKWTPFRTDNSPLRALSLLYDDVWQWLPQNPFPNLTHLCLFPQSRTHFHDHSVGPLLGMLSRTPMLKYLHLGLTALWRPDEDDPLPIVRLDRLRTMSIHKGDLEVAFILLVHLKLPDDVLLCIDGASSKLLGPTPGEPYHDARRIPSLSLLDNVTFMELSVSSSRFLLTGYSIHFTSGFYIDTSDPDVVRTIGGMWLQDLHTMISLSNVMTLHVNIDESEAVHRILPSILPRFVCLQELCLLVARQPVEEGISRKQLVEAFFRALDQDSAMGTLDIVCPQLQVLGLEAELAPHNFPFSALQSMAASRMRSGHRLARFVYHPDTRRHDTVGARNLFTASFLPLSAAFVDGVEHRRAGDARMCPFASRECWDHDGSEAERYWPLPSKLGYGLEMPDDFEISEEEHTTGDMKGDGEPEDGADVLVAELVS